MSEWQDETIVQSGKALVANDLSWLGKHARCENFLQGIDLNVDHGNYFTLLGPRGSGKSLLIRLIAGFEPFRSGELYLYGEDIRFRPPEKRRVNTIFHTAALFPHLTVAQNVAFGMLRLSLPKKEITSTVERLLRAFRLKDKCNLPIQSLDEAEVQLVSIARAIATSPRLLLLDEPFSRLDFEQRRVVRDVLRVLQYETGLTMIAATQDHYEAVGYSDYIAIMLDGQLHQVGTPKEIIERPADAGVAKITGDTNVIPVRVLSVQGEMALCDLGDGKIFAVRCDLSNHYAQDSQLVVRPEFIRLDPNRGDIEARLMHLDYHVGKYTAHYVTKNQVHIRVSLPSDNVKLPEPGQEIWLRLAPGRAHVVPQMRMSA